MRNFASTVAGVLGVMGVALILIGLRNFGNPEERIIGIWQTSVGFGNIASSAVIGTLGAILTVLEERLPEDRTAKFRD